MSGTKTITAEAFRINAFTAPVVPPRPTSCLGVQLPKIPRPSCPQSHNQLMLIAQAPQNHKLNFKCKTTKTVAKQQDRFFESSLITVTRDSEPEADHATDETSIQLTQPCYEPSLSRRAACSIYIGHSAHLTINRCTVHRLRVGHTLWPSGLPSGV